MARLPSRCNLVETTALDGTEVDLHITVLHVDVLGGDQCDQYDLIGLSGDVSWGKNLSSSIPALIKLLLPWLPLWLQGQWALLGHACSLYVYDYMYGDLYHYETD